MDVCDGVGQHRDHPRGGPGAQGVPSSSSVEAASLDVLHLEVGPPIVVAKAVNLHDIGVAELGDGLGLRLEAGSELGAVCAPGRNIFKAQRRLSLIWRAL